MDIETEGDKKRQETRRMLHLFNKYQNSSYPHMKTAYVFEKNKCVNISPDLSNTLDLGIVGARQHDLNKRVDEIKQKLNALVSDQHDLNFRLNVFEQMLNIPPPNNIVTFAKEVFTTLKIIERVYIIPIRHGFQFVIIHNAETAPEAISQTRLGLNMLEDEFPDLYFERLVLHTSEVHKEHLQQAKLVLEQRK